VQVDVPPKTAGPTQLTVPPLAGLTAVVGAIGICKKLAISEQSAAIGVDVKVVPTSEPVQVPPSGVIVE
jgi:hypothetical protein